MRIPAFIISAVLLVIVGAVLILNLQKQTPTQSPAPQTPSQTPVISSPTESPKEEVIAINLEVPWALAFLPDEQGSRSRDNRLLVTERNGNIKLVDGKQVKKVFANKIKL